MPAIQLWNIVILFYCIGLFISIRHLIDAGGYLGMPRQFGDNPQITQFILVLSILGVGLFNYYVGRSSALSLIGPSWPMLILATIFTDQLFIDLSPIIYNRMVGIKTKILIAFRKDFKVLFFVGLFYCLSSSLLSVLVILQAYLNVISEQWSGVLTGTPALITVETDFIRSTSNTSDKVFILSDLAPELSLYTGHARPVNVPGFGELILRKDMDTINAFLSHPPKGAKIYWDPGFEPIKPADFINLHAVAATKNHELILFKDSGP